MTLTVGPVLHPDFMSKIGILILCLLTHLSPFCLKQRRGVLFIALPPIEDSRIARLVKKLVSQQLRKVKCIKLFSVC